MKLLFWNLHRGSRTTKQSKSFEWKNVYKLFHKNWFHYPSAHYANEKETRAVSQSEQDFIQNLLKQNRQVLYPRSSFVSWEHKLVRFMSAAHKHQIIIFVMISMMSRRDKQKMYLYMLMFQNFSVYNFRELCLVLSTISSFTILL